METISRKDLTLAWLAGMIDADGCISVLRQVNNRRTRKTEFLRPYVQLSTTCTLTYEYTLALYQELMIPVHVSMRPNVNPETQKPVYIFNTIGMKRCTTILPLLLPYLVTKKREAELLIEFIVLRETLGQRQHSPREDAIAQELREIKASRNMVKNPQRLYARLH